ncbi:MAG: rhodanese-like domain-containing protein [Oscillospiraceae bacterium]|nr:rhodanese-like domain-containing protein [Oscillospiraceae bacterium]
MKNFKKAFFSFLLCSCLLAALLLAGGCKTGGTSSDASGASTFTAVVIDASDSGLLIAAQGKDFDLARVDYAAGYTPDFAVKPMQTVTLTVGALARETYPVGLTATAVTLTADVGAAAPVIAQSAAAGLMQVASPTILDVRTDAEYVTGHIDGALLLPYDQIASLAPAQLPDKNVLLLTYCRTGARSAAAAKTLISMGYTRVFDMGGIVSWTGETVMGE